MSFLHLLVSHSGPQSVIRKKSDEFEERFCCAKLSYTLGHQYIYSGNWSDVWLTGGTPIRPTLRTLSFRKGVLGQLCCLIDKGPVTADMLRGRKAEEGLQMACG